MPVANQVDYRGEREHIVDGRLHSGVVEEKDRCTDEGSPSVEEDKDVNEFLTCFFEHILA